MSYPAIDFLYLNEEDMIKAGVMNISDCIDTMEEVLKCLRVGDFMMGGKDGTSHGCMVTFPETSPFPNMPTNKGEDRRFMAMPAYLGGPFDMAGCKWYGSNTANKEKGLPRSILMVMLNDKDTGAPIALLSANLLSAYRTGGIPGVGIRHLARKDSKVLGIYGPGGMSRTAIDAFAAECPEMDTVKIKGRSKRGIDGYIAYVKEKHPQFTTIEVVDSLEALVRDSDCVYFGATATSDPSTYAKVMGEWVKPGAFIVGTSAYDVEDQFLIDKCKLVVDDIGLYDAWAQEYPYPTFGYGMDIFGCKFTDMVHDDLITRDRIISMGDILLGKSAGRESDDQIITMSVGGMPVEDVAWGKYCYDNAVKMGIGTKLHLWDASTFA